jgi:hypothetical protein
MIKVVVAGMISVFFDDLDFAQEAVCSWFARGVECEVFVDLDSH